MSKVYVVTAFFRAVDGSTGKVLTSHTKVLKAFDAVTKAVEYIAYENPLKIIDNMELIMYNEDWEGNWMVDSTDISEDQLTVWHRLVSKIGTPKHWLVILEIHEMEVE